MFSAGKDTSKINWKRNALIGACFLLGFVVINTPSFETTATLLINEGLIIQLIAVALIFIPLLYFFCPQASIRDGVVWGFLALLFAIFFFLTQNTISVIANTESIMEADSSNCALATELESSTTTIVFIPPNQFSTSAYDDNTGLLNYQFGNNAASLAINGSNQMKLANELIAYMQNNPRDTQLIGNFDKLLVVPANEINQDICMNLANTVSSKVNEWNSTTAISAILKIAKDYADDVWISITSMRF